MVLLFAGSDKSVVYDCINSLVQRFRMKTVFVAGRFNPLTQGHAGLIEAMRLAGDTRQPRIFVTKTQDIERNPLSPEEKLGFIRRVYPGIEVGVADNPFEAGRIMAREGVTDALLVIGADRISMGENFVRYAEDLGLERAEIHAVQRPEGAASATAARAAIRAGDLDSWRRLAPTRDEDWIQDVYRAVRETGA